MAMASPRRATASSESCTASIAPEVTMKSSGESAHPPSSDLRASCRRSKRAPGGSSYVNPRPSRAIPAAMRPSFPQGNNSGSGWLQPSGTRSGSRALSTTFATSALTVTGVAPADGRVAGGSGGSAR